MINRTTISKLSLMVALAAVAVACMEPVRQAWLINAWSVQYTHHLFNPLAKRPVLIEPPVEHARAGFWLASAALQVGQPTLAETLIASQAMQGDPLAMRLMADVRLAQGDFNGALAIWQQVGDVASLLRAASQAQEAGHLEDALAAYEAVWTLDSESGTLPLVNFLLNYGQDYSRAESELRKSLAVLPKSRYWPIWSNRLGEMLRNQKRWDEAVAVYEGVIAHTPEDWVSHIGLGWTRYERGDGLQAAMDEFQKAVKISKSQGSGQLANAQVLTREKQFEEADAWFVQALALNPEAKGWYIARGNAARQAGNLDLALASYQEVLTRFPDYASAYYEIAYTYQLNEQPALAVAAIEQALVLMSPPDASYCARAGEIYERTGDKNRALHAYRQALLIDPQNATALEGAERLDKLPHEVQ